MTGPSRLPTVVASLAIGAVALIAIAGCASPAASKPSPSSCAADLAACGTFTSTEGSDAGADVSWLKTKPLEVTFTTENGSDAMVMKTPCNTVTVPVTVSSSTLTPNVAGISATAKGCLDNAGQQEAWATRFASQKLKYTLDQKQLTLTGNAATILLRS